VLVSSRAEHFNTMAGDERISFLQSDGNASAGFTQLWGCRVTIGISVLEEALQESFGLRSEGAERFHDEWLEVTGARACCAAVALN